MLRYLYRSRLGTLRGMGSEGVELVRRVYLAWQAGDLEELLSLVDREVRSLRPVLHRFEDHGSRVLVLGRLVGASRLGEGDLDVRVSWVWTVRAGRVVAMQAFLEERAARAAIASP